MNILFLTLGKMDNLNSHGLYIDLVNEMRNRGNIVYILVPNEKRNGISTLIEKNNNVEILRVRTGNITETNILTKGISTILIQSQYIRAIKKHYSEVVFDLVLYSTPPVTFAKVISYIKHRDNSMTYLILKDIFPQNAVDLEILKKNSIVYHYFKFKERKLYKISDFIGCTSKANIEYLIKNNSEVIPNKVELFPNSIKPRLLTDRINDTKFLRKKYDLPEEAVIFVYGGNIGKPQGIDFIKEILLKIKSYNNAFIIISGSGTEFSNLSRFVRESCLNNVRVQKSLPQDEYWEFLSCCDVGLVFLDKRFTVPNTPARLTYYMESALPILAATDSSTDINKIIKDAECGFWVESSESKHFIQVFEMLLTNSKLRRELGINGRCYLEKNLVIDSNYNSLNLHVKDWREKNV